MTIRELIKTLQTFPGDFDVWVEPGDFAASEGQLIVRPGGTYGEGIQVRGL